MSNNPINIIISDDETTPIQLQSKKKKQKTISTVSNPNSSTVFIIDDEPTPHKSSSSSNLFTPSSVVPETPSVVPETPMEDESSRVQPFLVRCNYNNNTVSLIPAPNPTSGLICLESDEEPEGSGSFSRRLNETNSVTLEVDNDFEVRSTCSEPPILQDNSYFPSIVQVDLPQVSDHSEDDILHLTTKNMQVQGHSEDDIWNLTSKIQVSDHSEEDDILPLTSKNVQTKGKNKGTPKKKNSAPEKTEKVRKSKEEKARLMNEKKQQKEQEKLDKIALKAQAAESKKMQKEIERWEKGKFAQQSIVAKIDTKVVEQGSIGGQLLTRLAEKGITFQITSNPVERSIIWTMSVPENIAEALTRGTVIPYVLLVFEADEFCRLVADESLVDHVSRVQSIYPSYTLCYLTNRLMAHINKKEQEHYKHPGNHSGWTRPPVEQMLSRLCTHFVGVHSRLCTDEAELAEHVVGLTCSLASCQFRKKLTCLSVNANGSLIPKDTTDRALIKRSTWLKALIAIPKVQPRFAVAIWKTYPTMKSLLSVYMDPTKSEREKEFLLANLITEGVVGDNRRLGDMCSKRVYRILMAQSGNTKTDDVENGADFFR
ncbi:crossover junction endonuclease EME1 [Rutidosis leptorrhynchoides]|uniref:crossover junction endonuclease EME1 n=1 Tax=Rutidosis leptorrhynchoides TaxID=125765 RepID=UPI003A98F4DF